MMNKYTELSDFEINKAVFQKAKIKYKYFRFLPNGVITYNIKGKYQVFDPCNNPADAMPIIIDNFISLMADVLEDGKSPLWIAQDVSANITTVYKSNPLRAAMEVFLMMKDAESNN